MSNAIENRVVEMRFDNKQFEEGVADSINSLARLNKSLDMQESIKGLEGIQQAANTLNLDNVARDVSYLTDWFSIMGTVGQQVVVRLTNAFMDLGGAMTRMVSELTVGQISAGFDKYEEKTKAVQTIMNATDRDIEDVNEQMLKLNWYTDETSYSFTGMVNNIAKFTSNGIKLEQAVTSMMGIGNAAGLAGASVTDATHAMDGFSKAMGQGYMNRLNWQWIKTAHMDTVKFKEELISAAVSLNQLKYVGEEAGTAIYETIDGNRVSVNNFEEALKDGWMNVDVMNKALSHFGDTTEELYKKYQEFEGEYTTSELIEMFGDDLDALGIKAFRAAQEAKTFTDAIEAVKDAVSTGWMNTFELIFGNYEEAKVIWTELANELWDVFASGAEARNQMLREWHDMGGYQKAIQTIKNVWHTIRNIVDPLNDVFRDFFPETTAIRLYRITEALEEFTRHVRDLFSEVKELQSFDDSAESRGGLLTKFIDNPEGVERLEAIRYIFSGFISIFRVLADVVEAVAHAFSPLIKTFGMVFDAILSVLGVYGDLITRINTAIHESQMFRKVANLVNAAFEKMNKVMEPIIRIIKNIVQYMHDLIESLSGVIAKVGELDSVKTLVGHFNDFVSTIRTKVGGAVDKLITKLNKLARIDLKAPSTEDFLQMIDFLVTKFNEFIEEIEQRAKESGITDWFSSTFTIIRDTATNLWNSLMGSIDDENSFFHKAYDAAASFAKGILEGLNTVTFNDMASAAGVAGLGYMLYQIITLIWDLQKSLAVKDFSLEGAINRMLKPFDQLASCLRQFSRSIAADALIKQANAIAILAGAVVVLSAIDPDALASATASIITLMLGMKAIIDSLTAYNKIRVDAGGIANRITNFLEGIKSALKNAIQFQSIGFMFLEIAASMVIFAIAINKLNSIPDLNPNTINALWAIFLGIGTVMLAAKAQFSKDGVGSWFMGVNWASIGLMFVGMGTAIYMIVSAINKLAKEIDSTVLGKGLITVAGIGSLLAILFGFIGKTNAKSSQMLGFASSMFILAIAIEAMTVPFKQLANFNLRQLNSIHKAVDEIGKIMAILAAVMAVSSFSSFGKNGVFGIDFTKSGGTEIIKMAAAITILAGAIILLGKYSEEASAGIAIFNQAAWGLGAIFIAMGIANLAASLKETGDSANQAGSGFKNFGIGIGAAFGGIGVFLIGLSMAADKMDAIAAGIGKLAQAIVDNAGLVIEAILIIGGSIFSAIMMSKKKWILASITIIMAICEALDEAGPEIIGTIAKTVKRAVDYIVSIAAAITDTLVHALVVIINELANAIENNKQPIIDAVSRLIDAIVDVFASLIHKLFPFISEGFAEVIGKFGVFIAGAAGIVKALGGIATIVGKVTPLIAKFKGLFAGLVPVFDKIALAVFNLSPDLGMLMFHFVSNIGPIAAVTAGLLGFGAVIKSISDSHYRAMYGMSEENEHFIETVDRLYDSQNRSFDQMKKDILQLNSQYEGYKKLAEEYDLLLDSDGKVKEGQEKRAEVILETLSEAMGMEIDDIRTLIEENGNLSDAIADVIEMKKAEAILSSMNDEYAEALKNQLTAYRDLSKASADLNETDTKIAELRAEFESLLPAVEQYNAAVDKGQVTAELEAQYARYQDLQKILEVLGQDRQAYYQTYKEALDIYNDAADVVQKYENLETAIKNKDYTAIRDQIGALHSDIQKDLNSMTDKSVESYGQIYAEAVKTFGDIKGIAEKNGWDISDTMTADLQNDIDNALEKYAQFVVDSGDAGSAAGFAFDKDLMNALSGTNENLFNQLNAMAEEFDISNVIKIKADSSGQSYFTQLLTNIESGQYSVESGLDSLINRFGIDVTDKAWITTEGYFNTILSELANGQLEVEEAVEALTPAFEVDTTVPADEAAAQYEQQIRNRFGEFGPNLGGEVDKTMFEVLDSSEEAADAANSEMDEYVQSILDKKDEVEEAAGEVSSAGADAAGSEDKKQAWYDVGVNSVMAMANGFMNSSAINTLMANIDTVANQAIERAKSKSNFDINSPSKKFLWIGRMLDEGLASGLVKYVTVATDAVDTVGNSILEMMKEAMSDVSDALDADMDYEPTIRPVLDLSGVSGGAATINSLLGIQNGLALPTTFGPHGAIASTLNDISAAKVSDEEMYTAVNKLHDDISTLSDDITAMYEDDNRVYEFNLNTNIDGRNVAKSTARYNRQELALLDRNANRRGGKVR